MTGPDTGLDLESILLLMRADLGTWALLGLGTLVLGLIAWLSWGSRRAFRRCLALSVVAHAGLVLYGSTVPSVFRALNLASRDSSKEAHIRRIRVSPVTKGSERAASNRPETVAPSVKNFSAGGKLDAPSPDLANGPIRLLDPGSSVRAAVSPGHEAPSTAPVAFAKQPGLSVAQAIPPGAPAPDPGSPESRPPQATASAWPPRPAAVVVPPASELAQLVPKPVKLKEESTSARSTLSSPATSLLAAAELRREAVRESLKVDRAARPHGESVARPIPLVHAMPGGGNRATPGPALAELVGTASTRSLSEVPRFYRSRLDANRTLLAQRSGASTASEQAVERALDWLARHQDADGRWDGGTARYEDGTAVPGDDDFTVHCPPGETCFGECIYWEADTALTGLALLAYLGAGYTQNDGKYADTVAKGSGLPARAAEARRRPAGPSRAVGMYCHAMATLALCEAYALTGDERLRDPVERAVLFLVRAAPATAMAWRYEPGAAPATPASSAGSSWP